MIWEKGREWGYVLSDCNISNENDRIVTEDWVLSLMGILGRDWHLNAFYELRIM